MSIVRGDVPTFLFDELPIHWQMARWEKYALTSILEAAKPKVAIEIGTADGGSLQVIAGHAEKVYSLDLDSSLKGRLGRQLPNVEFLAGDSHAILPTLLDRIMEQGEELGFVLIDGDHSSEGVRRDISAVLRYVPVRPVFIVLHDSFHPPCRQGILSADWKACEYVHYLEIDFVPGTYYIQEKPSVELPPMYGGLAVAIMRPERRDGPLTITEGLDELDQAAVLCSSHAPPQRQPLLVRALQKAKRLVLGPGKHQYRSAGA